MTTEVAALGGLYGLFVVLITFSSNLVDIREDEATGRKSLCVLLGSTRVRWLFFATMAVAWAAYVAVFLAGWAPTIALLAAPLLVVLHLRAARAFWSGEGLKARLNTFRAARWNGIALAAALLLRPLSHLFPEGPLWHP
jgi:1,4-dihydroxy-2-naphthoate octaprenyltransferase